VNTAQVMTAPSLGMMDLVEVIQRLSLARDVVSVREIVRRSARRLLGADGATFVLRDGDRCHYVDEDAISPLWKGQKFPLEICISGWAMLNRRAAVIEDIYADDRIPHDAYRKTFVKSLVMVPIRTLDPIGAIGTYWATPRQPTPEEVQILQALADSTAVAMENVRVFTELEQRVQERTADLQAANRRLEDANRELLAAHQRSDRVFAAYAKALPGTVLDGKYRLDEELGAGGFGVVFRGRHLVLDRPIAIKVFRPGAGNDSAMSLQRFLREGATAASLDHPHAVHVLDSGVSSEGIAFLIMELLLGNSLRQELTGGPLPLRRCAAIAREVADVLAAAHRRGILHRDVKPDNVFLHRAADGEETVKVVDFGIAKFFGEGRTDPANNLTRTGEFVGTPSYIAPERVAGGADDGRSDVFSLGAMLYEMICCASPWPESHQLRMMLGLGQGHPPLPTSEFRLGVPAELEALVARTLAWDSAQRPTAEELATLLTDMMPRLEDGPAEVVGGMLMGPEPTEMGNSKSGSESEANRVRSVAFLPFPER